MPDTQTTARSFRPSPTIVICSIAALVAVVGLFLPSLSPVQTSTQAAAPAAAVQVGSGIQIVDFGYAGELVVKPGQTVQVVNEDGVPHTVTANDGSFDTGVIGGNANGSFTTPNADGTFSFICTIHPSMSGELTVSS